MITATASTRGERITSMGSEVARMPGCALHARSSAAGFLSDTAVRTVPSAVAKFRATIGPQ